MLDITIYKEEKEIAPLILKGNSISHLVPIKDLTCNDFPTNIFPSKLISSGNFAERSNFDLMYLQSLLVSSVVNGNDDYFAPIELWLAKNTAKDKPFNYEHNEDDIIGHMINSHVVDADYNKLDENTSVDNLPATIHVICGAVLYKHWDDTARQERMNSIIAEIKDNKWYVSVECLFPKFDYLLQASDGKSKLVVRNEQTAFLSKYLRAYKGVGVYNNQKIIRVPRNLIFSGKGLVKVPANSASEIFVSQNNLKNITNNLEVVYKISEVNNMNEKELADFTAKYNKLETEYNSLKASVNEDKSKELKAQLDLVTKTCEGAVQEISVLKANLEKASSEKLELTKAHDELVKQKKMIEDKLAEIDKAKSHSDRINLCKSKMGMDDANAESYTNSLNLLTDEAFAKHIEFQAGFVKNTASVIVPDPKVLEKTEAGKDATLAVSAVVPTFNDEVKKLSASLVDYMAKNGITKKAEVKFKV